MIKININLAKVAPYVNKLLSYIDEKIEENKREAAQKLFRETLDEIYFNIEILQKQDYNTIKTLDINSLKIRKIIKSIKTAKTQKCKEYSNKFPQLKKKDSRKFFDKISIALHKINVMRDFSEKKTNELKGYKVFRPAVRLNNICKTYLEVIEIIK